MQDEDHPYDLNEDQEDAQHIATGGHVEEDAEDVQR